VIFELFFKIFKQSLASSFASLHIVSYNLLHNVGIGAKNMRDKDKQMITNKDGSVVDFIFVMIY
jgi:uncharacterized membrane protein YbjE (DUF340 family)